LRVGEQQRHDDLHSADKVTSPRRAVRFAWLVVTVFALLFVLRVLPAAAATTAGTVISETVTATYQNAAGTNFNATSNTVTTTVQNAPSLTVTDVTAQNVGAGQTIVDTFTLTNTGNNSGTLALTGNATFGGTGSATLQGYVFNSASTGTCSVASPCTYTVLNALGGMSGVAVSGFVNVGVVYQVSAGATVGQTIQTTLTANVTYAAGTGTTAQTSSNASATPTDTVAAGSLTVAYTSHSDASLTAMELGLVTFTLTSTGAANVFNVPSDATMTGPGTLMGYTLQGATTGTCSTASVCNLSTLNTQVTALGPYASGTHITVAVEYQVNQNAASGTVSVSLTAKIGGSSNVTGTDSTGESVTADARLDMQVTVSTPATSATPLAWTIRAADGGGAIARASTSVKAFLGDTTSGSKGGDVIFDALPKYNGTLLGMTGAPTVTLNSMPSSVTSLIYYSTAATPSSASDWSTTYTANATYFAVFIYATNNQSNEFNSGAATTAGNVSSANAALTITFNTNQPSVCGASVTDQANSVIEGSDTSTLDPAPAFLIGQGLTGGQSDNGSISLTGAETNTTASSSSTPPGGASNIATGTAYASGTASCLTVAFQSVAGTPVTAGTLNLVDFTLTNTGTSSGHFSVPSDFTLTGPATVTGYVINDQGSGTCTKSVPCNLSTLNTQLGLLAATAQNGTVKVGCEYTVSTTATVGLTINATLTAAITGSSSASGTDTTGEPVEPESRMDIQETASQPSGAGTAITWTIDANDGAQFTKIHNSPSVKNFLPTSNNYVAAIFIQVPTYNGVALSLAGTPTSTINSGAVNNTTSVLYYSTAATPASSSDWSTTYTSSAKWIAASLEQSTATAMLSTNPSGSTGAGSVTSPGEWTVVFTTSQPVGCGANTASDVSAIANFVGGTLTEANLGQTPGIISPVISTYTADTGSISLTSTLTNTTPSSGTTAPGGASNAATSQGFVSTCTENGPIGSPTSTGSYPAAPNSGAASPTDSLDFTTVGFVCANGSAVNNGSTLCTVPTVNVPNTLKNTGSATDTKTLTAYAPTGFKVQLFSTSSCPTGPYTTVPSCTLGSSISSLSSAGGSVTSSGISLASGATYNYVAQYTAASGVTPFTAVDGKLTGAGSVGTGGDTNDTHDDLYPGGVIKLTKLVSVTSTNCANSPPAGTVCPGGVLQYSEAYTNIAPSAAVNTNVGTEPSFAYAALKTGAGQVAITEDGNASGNNWATDSFGLSAAPSDTTSGTTYSYSGASGFASGTYPSITAGYTKFIATIGGASATLAPGASGTITFNVTIR
jgi:hypothetical protein